MKIIESAPTATIHITCPFCWTMWELEQREFDGEIDLFGSTSLYVVMCPEHAECTFTCPTCKKVSGIQAPEERSYKARYQIVCRDSIALLISLTWEVRRWWVGDCGDEWWLPLTCVGCMLFLVLFVWCFPDSAESVMCIFPMWIIGLLGFLGAVFTLFGGVAVISSLILVAATILIGAMLALFTEKISLGRLHRCMRKARVGLGWLLFATGVVALWA